MGSDVQLRFLDCFICKSAETFVVAVREIEDWSALPECLWWVGRPFVAVGFRDRQLLGRVGSGREPKSARGWRGGIAGERACFTSEQPQRRRGCEQTAVAAARRLPR